MAHWSISGVLTGRGRGGSRKGRYYQRIKCEKCGKPVASNVLPQHRRRCVG